MDNWEKLQEELEQGPAEPVDEADILEEKVRKVPEPVPGAVYEEPRKPSEYDPDGVAYKTPIPPAQPTIPEGRPAPPPRRARYNEQ